MILRLRLLLICVSACVSEQIVLQHPGASEPPAQLRRHLHHGEIEVFATTDTHGWLRGHLGRNAPEPNFSGDLGDLYSFITRYNATTDRDVLLVDSGDIVDGNGLVDADQGVKGHGAREILKRMPYDVLTVGNHGLYNFTVAADIHRSYVPHWRGRYVASNVDIHIDGDWRPFASRYRRFTTRNGVRVLSFGVLFAFPYADRGLRVQSPAAMVKEQWFVDALDSEVDLFLLVGHMAVSDPAWLTVLEAIKTVHPTTPIIASAGHAHIRACERPDERSILMASGRYLETVGHMSLKWNDTRLERRYIDQNRRSYAFHLNDTAFDTSAGRQISSDLILLAARLNLSTLYGQVPRNYYLNRYPPDHPNSLVHLMTSEILPRMVRNASRPHDPLVLLNTGSLRFDLSAGPLTKDSQALILPFLNRAVYVPDVPRSVARRILDVIHGEPGDEDFYGERELREQALEAYESWSSTAADEKLSYGLVTRDGCGPDGDDTAHRPLPAYRLPEYVGTAFPAGERVDIVCFDFILPVVLRTLTKLSDRIYTIEDVRPYADVRTDTLLIEYARRYWQ